MSSPLDLILMVVMFAPFLLLFLFAPLVLLYSVTVAPVAEALQARADRKRRERKEAQRQAILQRQTTRVTQSVGSSDDDGPTYWATGTYDPDRYYSAAREYGRSGMDYIRDAYGDLDTYESNGPFG
jgi:hypothetical protein